VRRLRRAACALLLVVPLAPAATYAEEPTIELHAELAPDPVGLDELALFTLRIDGPGFGLGRVEPGFLLDNFEGSGGPSTSQSTSWVNGQSSSRVQFTWRLRPKSIGTGRVHDIRVEIDRHVYQADDVSVQVVAQAPPGRAQPAPQGQIDPFSRLFDEDPFGLLPRRRRAPTAARPKIAVRSLVAPPHAWVGQQVTWTLALDTQTDISGFRPRSLPTFAGFWSREIELPQRPRPEWIEAAGEKFGRVPMLRRALFPLRSGKLRIDGLTTDVLARMSDEDWIGAIRRDEPLELATPAVTVDVRPLPKAPSAASGVVGRLAIDARVEPARIDVGQATTVVVKLSSDGNLQGLTPAELPLPLGLRGFAPAASSQESVVDGRLTTDLEWRYVVLADRGGSYEIPAPTLTYFDPATESYALASAASMRLAVRAGAAESDSTSAETGSSTDGAATDVAHRGEGAGWWRFDPRLVAGLLGGAVLLATAVPLIRRRFSSTAARRLRTDLAAARRIAGPREAARAIDEAWRSYLAERCSLSRGVPLTQWREKLGGRGLRGDQIEQLLVLFEEIQLLEFAPELADASSSRAEIERRSLRLARRLR